MKLKISKKFVILLCLAGILAAGTYIYGFRESGHKPEPSVSSPEKRITVYYIPVTNYFSSLGEVTKSDLSGYQKSGNLFFEEGEEENLKALLGGEYIETKTIKRDDLKLAEDQIALVRFDAATPGLKSLKYEGLLLWEVKDKEDYGLKKEITVSEEDPVEEYDPGKVVRIKAGGDVMLSRHVATKISTLGILSPWKKVSDFLADAEITFLNLEVPLSDRYPVPKEGMSFIAPTSYAEGILSAGVDIVSVANNHSANFGQKVFTDDLETLSKNKILACGGGLADSEARTAKIIEKNGTKFSFLCYNAIVGGLEADEGPGMATLKIEPWYRDDEASIKKLEADIKKAKENSDVVIVSPHWGVEYKLNPSESQKKVAERAISAGADLVLGTHPHVVQGSEYYNGKYITYSLGNLIFDQEWSAETKQGTILDNYYYGKKHVSASLIPVEIENYHQPYLAVGNLKRSISERIKSASLGF